MKTQGRVGLVVHEQMTPWPFTTAAEAPSRHMLTLLQKLLKQLPGNVSDLKSDPSGRFSECNCNFQASSWCPFSNVLSCVEAPSIFYHIYLKRVRGCGCLRGERQGLSHQFIAGLTYRDKQPFTQGNLKLAYPPNAFGPWQDRRTSHRTVRGSEPRTSLPWGAAPADISLTAAPTSSIIDAIFRSCTSVVLMNLEYVCQMRYYLKFEPHLGVRGCSATSWPVFTLSGNILSHF